jgi:RNA polymerase sigma-70 factor (ECF subfamily)
MGSEPADTELLGRLSADPAAFEIFYRRHVDRVIGFTARRVRDPADVADLVASTFLTVLTAARSYDESRGEPTAWLLGITARLIAGARRRRGREAAAAARIAGRRLIDASDIERLEERIDAARASEAVRGALGRLKPRAREALLLAGPDGLTSRQAAAVLGISPAAFRMRLTSALVGPARIDGQRAIELRQGTAARGMLRIWVSPDTYLPIRTVSTPPGVPAASPQAIRDDYTWLPDTAANRRQLTRSVAIPAGFRQVSPH